MKDYYKGLFTKYWEYLAIKTATKNNVLDIIDHKKLTIGEISFKTKFKEDVLIHLLDFLEIAGLVVKKNNKYALTESGKLFTENHPESIKYISIHWAEEHLTVWQNLEYTLKTGKPAFEHIYNKAFFDYLAEDKSKLDNYHKAMNEYARDDYKDLCSKIDFTNSRSIMDVGGGYGALLGNLIETCPEKKYYLFDKPEVVDKVEKTDMEKIGGNFFVEIPNVADTIIMSRVIHDWDDEKALIILKNVYRALPDKGNLFLIENHTDKIKDKAALLSLNMRLITKSFERTGSEYQHLLRQTGFEITGTCKLNDLQHIIKARKL